MSRTLLFALVLLPRIAFGQSSVVAEEIEVGLGTHLMQVASIAFNPWQRNTRWPLFAYPVDEVFGSRRCDSFGDGLPEGNLAFVYPDNASERSQRIFRGVRSDQTMLIEICNTENEDYALALRNLLSSSDTQENLSGTQDMSTWYLLSERPLQHLRSSFRTNLVPLDVGESESIAPDAVQDEPPQSTQ